MRLQPLLLAVSTAMLVIACSTPRAPEPPAGAPAEEAADALAEFEAREAVAQARRQGHEQKAMAAVAAPAIAILPPPPPAAPDRENYAHLEPSAIQRVAQAPVSTFSIDVDTGSYSNVRRMLNGGRLPPQDAVRVEELINYFDYGYALPREAGVPFSVTTEIARTPWNPKTHLLHVGIQGWKPQGPAKRSNLVFLVDVSGSMADADKLPLVVSSLKLLARQLTAQDRISLVVYAGNTGVVLPPTPGDQTDTILAALDRLGAGGSTNGGEGIRLAYAMARQGYIRNGNNRVLLATDGDFNVGMVSFEQLVDLVEEERKSGVALTTLGFGSGNYNDRLMERLADAGNGNHAYIDSLSEAQKVLVEQREATLTTIARDVKIQIEFNPAHVAEYRLIGYENRMLRREDFANDRIDAGDIGAGHTVTALYEIALVGSGGERVEPLRYAPAKAAPSTGAELAHLRLRYKRPDDGMQAQSRLIERGIYPRQVGGDAIHASAAFRLSAAVAGFGQLLRGGAYTGDFTYTQVAALARSARGEDRHGRAGEFLQLLALADGLSAREAGVQHIGE